MRFLFEYFRLLLINIFRELYKSFLNNRTNNKTIFYRVHVIQQINKKC